MTELTPRERFALSAPPPSESWYENYRYTADRPNAPACMDNYAREYTPEEKQQVSEYRQLNDQWYLKRAAAAAADWAWAYADAALEARG